MIIDATKDEGSSSMDSEQIIMPTKSRSYMHGLVAFADTLKLRILVLHYCVRNDGLERISILNIQVATYAICAGH